MKFELTISGLCILAMKSNDAKPVHPDTIDVIVPAAEHHRCRFVWDPDQVRPNRVANLVVDPHGRRYASIDLIKRSLDFSFSYLNNPNTQHTVHWGGDAQMPTAAWEESQMDWVPKLESLGFGGFSIPPVGNDLPDTMLARLRLPFGTLESRNMVVDPFSKQYTVWEYTGGLRRALANEVVYTVDGIGRVTVTDTQSGEIVHAAGGGPQTVRMCISNDMEYVPLDYTADIDQLTHLGHLSVIASGTFVVPRKVTLPRTGHKICGQVVYVYHG